MRNFWFESFEVWHHNAKQTRGGLKSKMIYL